MALGKRGGKAGKVSPRASEGAAGAFGQGNGASKLRGLFLGQARFRVKADADRGGQGKEEYGDDELHQKQAGAVILS